VLCVIKKLGASMQKDNYFVKQIYMGSDGMDFKEDFLEFLKSVLNSQRYEAMSDHQLYLQGGKKAIEEIIESLEE